MRSRDGLGCSRTSPGRSRWCDFPTEGGPSLTPRVQLKYWPVETNGQPVIWAALDLRKTLKRVRHQGDRRLRQQVHLVRDRQRAGEMGSADARDRRPQPAVHLRPRVRGRADHHAFVHRGQGARSRDPAADVEAQGDRRRRAGGDAAADGAAGDAPPRPTAESIQVEIVDPLGHPDNPMQDNDIEEKFNAMAEPVLGRSAAAARSMRCGRSATRTMSARCSRCSI